ncbi:phosphopentomutase [Curvibacter sp. APW13]|uniref:phosphopentomutase n=1 Tax=Curvibacter sp. APW13 TaxID=3077236 RepID=UPI0028DF5539|nr:phosphopentomutase [Curvibacter sp. APW13]MDT8992312.1 phosphopentomutase [Curvibacter sp. APW13]
MARAITIVLDSFGVGAAPDAAKFGDLGANTFGHIAHWCAERQRPLRLPHLMQLGLGQVMQTATGEWPAGLEFVEAPTGAFGAAASLSAGKDTPSGHWELMGCPVPVDWGYFPTRPSGESVFPPDLMQRWLDDCGLEGTLGNCHASGTEIIAQLGDEHARTGWPICYTSSDSVFQVAAHEESFGLERLLDICAKAKPIFDEARIARVIARPFMGTSGHYQRTANRRDLTTPPPQDTLLDRLVAAGREVHAVGKIKDIFAGRGVTHLRKGADNAALCTQTLAALQDCPEGGMVFTNLVDFDMLFGHRRDAAGYADALEAFDRFLPTLLAALRPNDLLVLTADHGCDPTWPGSDHTRECVPVLWGGPAAPVGRALGLRSSFADVGQTLARHLAVPPLPAGTTCW